MAHASENAALEALAQRAEAAVGATGEGAAALLTDALAALAELRAVPMSTALLGSTGLGKRVRGLRKAALAGGTPLAAVAEAATGVEAAWRELVAAEAAAEEAPAPKRVKTEPSAAALPVKQEEGLPPPTGSADRDKIVALLAAALQLAAGEGVAGSPAHVAARVEAAMNATFGGVAEKDYKAKFRQLAFNLKDPKNTTLRALVLRGEISPSALLGLSSEELGSEERRMKNQEIREHAMWECERGQKSMVRAAALRLGYILQLVHAGWGFGSHAARPAFAPRLRAACVSFPAEPRGGCPVARAARQLVGGEGALRQHRCGPCRRRRTRSNAASASSASAPTSSCRRAARTSP